MATDLTLDASRPSFGVDLTSAPGEDTGSPIPLGAGKTARRMDAEGRLAQLTRVGVDLAKTVPLLEITAEHVASQAGVSKALVFHYFPTQRDLQAAVLKAAVVDMVGLLDPDPSLPIETRLSEGIVAFISFIEQQPMSYLSLARGTGSIPQLQEIFEETREMVMRVIRQALGIDEMPPALVIAVRGWIAMVEETVLNWLDTKKPISRESLVTYLQVAALKLLPEAMQIAANQG